jgi:hypothetical protein
MYTAKIEGRKSVMTVAVYEGDNAEEVSCHAVSHLIPFIPPCRNGVRISQP